MTITGGDMKRCIIGSLVALLMMVGVVHAGTVTFLPGSSSVNYSVDLEKGFWVSPTGLDYFGSTSWASAYTYPGVNPLFGLAAGANASAYSDAGIVLFFDGSLTLGQLQSVTIKDAGGSNVVPTVNLWLDTSNNGSFFQFSGTELTELGGDAYYGAVTPGNVGLGSAFTPLGGPVCGGYTLSQLQGGACAGIGANTAVALWIGITNGGSSNPNIANIAEVDVQTAAPVPDGGATLTLLGCALVGLGALRRKFRG